MKNTSNSSISGNKIYENTEDNKKVKVNNPWKKPEIIIAVNNTVNPDRNITKIVSRTLNYWRKNQDKYANYTINFSLQTSSEDPDIIIEFKDSVSCEFDLCVGNTSILNKNDVADTPEVIEIKSGENDRSTHIALKHAFGHLLGLTHCDKPYYLMLKNCERSNLTNYKDINDTGIAWRTSNLSVYINGNRNFHTYVKRALDYYEKGAEGWAPKDLSFNIVKDRFSADIIIEFNSSACGKTIYLERYNNKVCYNNINARDYDSDKNIEYYTSIVVRIRTTDINVIDWYVGYGLGFALGAENEDNLPEPFVNSDYNDASGLWWK